MFRVPFLLVLLAAAAWVGSRAGAAAGCAIVLPRGGPVAPRADVADEAAYVVWDEGAKTQHFIRRATFAGNTADLGFLVPTPGRPELEAADDALFDALAAVTAPRVEYREEVREVRKRFDVGGCLGTNANSTFSFVGASVAPPGAGGGVQVLERKRVGGYDATVLTFRRDAGRDAAAGAAELARWLAENGYQSSDALSAWLARYVEDQWFVTAFKVAAATPPDGPRGPELRAKAVRMSFKAEKPFYPYREPEPEPPSGAPRLLRVFLASSARFAGKLGGGARPWPGRTVWSGPVDALTQSRAFAAAGLLAQPSPGGWWLTEFEDRSSPRPGTDEVFFERSGDPAPVARPARVVVTTREVVVTPWWHGAVYYAVPASLVAALVLLRLARPSRPA